MKISEDQLQVCKTCLGYGWVCEDHPDKPWGGHVRIEEGACECGGAGSPCGKCVLGMVNEAKNN